MLPCDGELRDVVTGVTASNLPRRCSSIMMKILPCIPESFSLLICTKNSSDVDRGIIILATHSRRETQLHYYSPLSPSHLSPLHSLHKMIWLKATFMEYYQRISLVVRCKDWPLADSSAIWILIRMWNITLIFIFMSLFIFTIKSTE